MKITINTILLLLYSLIAVAQETKEKKLIFELFYTAELQSNFSNGKYNWVNLIEPHLGYKPWKNGSFDIETQTIYKTYKNRIANDLQVFSNIDEEIMALNISFGGYTHTFDKILIFGGLRNVNFDYFTHEYTSVFTNSSCGIYPTISENYPLPNYPLSAMCIHGEVKFTDALKLKTSFYNGISRKLFNDEKYSILAINPNRDGIFNMTELGYSNNKKYAYYGLGIATHTSLTSYTNDGESVTRFDYSLWSSVEQSFYHSGKKEIGLLAQASFSPEDRSLCSQYYGLGTIWKGFLPAKKATNHIGVFANYAKFGEETEKFIEITCRYGILDNLSIQPVFDYILTGNEVNCIGMIRVNYVFNNK
ncbi:MAG: carbohydrate porin [Dysgonamonadaceae bacterium]|jgi:porin|nr:carbohydrate porin [Dysgonamonadaceae bacterium]